MMVKILMVCLGNICRSPLAEGLLAHKLPKDTFYVDSAGTGAWHIGHSPDPRSVEVAKRNGVDISLQRGRQFSVRDYDEFDHIYVMDASNLENVLSLARTENDRNKVQMILDVLFPGEKVDVPDPYFGMQNGFNSVYAMLDEATTIIADDLKNAQQ
ncbi:low molecular weight phosphotyrosine protein phosphatase [Flavobacterium sp. SE-s28]|uniref:protein-tyrosine-phosphatase n=2 Tax=Flavobacterium silvaticum TaxID=1852020 RepID=A0A972JHK4_9FLAO|nr:low molecular weight protein-tyrosine-phosphatase [Flavobacterium silvaticum]NMH28035.1 low molecular weight phosphotyrosine protein phosphatase [Flavobacterium silvaticum]